MEIGKCYQLRLSSHHPRLLNTYQHTSGCDPCRGDVEMRRAQVAEGTLLFSPEPVPATTDSLVELRISVFWSLWTLLSSQSVDPVLFEASTVNITGLTLSRAVDRLIFCVPSLLSIPFHHSLIRKSYLTCHHFYFKKKHNLMPMCSSKERWMHI